MQKKVFDVASNGRFLFVVLPDADADEQLVLVRSWAQTVTSKR